MSELSFEQMLEETFKTIRNGEDVYKRQVDGEKITDIKYLLAGEKLQGEGIVLKKGKKNFRKVTMA